MNRLDAETTEPNTPDHGKFVLKTRIHQLRLERHTACELPIYIKREDELSSGVIGSKLRKYSSLVPRLKEEDVKHVALISGPNSNNAIAALQLLKEEEIKVSLFVRKAADTKIEGNGLLASMLCPKENIIEIEREQWPDVESIALEWTAKQTNTGIKSVVISEGAFDRKSLPGAMTLAHDILRNEAEGNIVFKNIYIDSGSGLSAIGLILGLASSNTTTRTIVVTLIAGDEQTFMQKLSTAQKWAESESTRFEGLNALELRFSYPPTAKSYGSINQTILDKTISIAREHGLLMDPIYSTKHFMSMENDLLASEIHSPALFIYNGGSLGLLGFQKQLQRTLSKAK